MVPGLKGCSDDRIQITENMIFPKGRCDHTKPYFCRSYPAIVLSSSELGLAKCACNLHPHHGNNTLRYSIWPESLASLSTSITNTLEIKYLAGPNYFLLPWWWVYYIKNTTKQLTKATPHKRYPPSIKANATAWRQVRGIPGQRRLNEHTWRHD